MNNNEWISVEDDLPDTSVNVLTIDESGYQEVALLYPASTPLTYTWRRTGLEYMEGSVTHWQPLPGPPKENEL